MPIYARTYALPPRDPDKIATSRRLTRCPVPFDGPTPCTHVFAHRREQDVYLFIPRESSSTSLPIYEEISSFPEDQITGDLFAAERFIGRRG